MSLSVFLIEVKKIKLELSPLDRERDEKYLTFSQNFEEFTGKKNFAAREQMYFTILSEVPRFLKLT